MLSEHLISHIGVLQGKTGLPLHRQLYEALRRAMLDGRLVPGDRLPSTRELAQDLHLSRNTVVAAIEQLTVEGYLHSRVGSGTFVKEGVQTRSRRKPPAASAHRMGLSRRGQVIATSYCADQLEVQPFTPGPGDFSAFPSELWQRLQTKHWKMRYPDMLDYSASGGYGPLRRAVADYLRVFRSAEIDTDQVIITNGTQQSLDLCTQLLADHQDTVWVEDPAYWGAVKAFQAGGLRLQAVPVDAQGLVPVSGDDKAPPRLIYVTPSHQYPTGAVMALERRHQLLGVARAHNAWILEDDYDSEFRFTGPPLASLTGLDPDERVLYMGSFSKVLYPGLKLAYLVVPRRLSSVFKQAHYDLNRPGQMPLQAALAEFIGMGHFANTLRRARTSYGQRRAQLLAALSPCLGTDAWISGAEQGLHLCLRLPGSVDDRAMALAIARRGMTVRPLSAYCLQRDDLRGLVIGYGYAHPADIAHWGPQLATAITGELGARARRAAAPRPSPGRVPGS